MASELLNVFKLAKDKLVYVTKISEEIVVVIADMSELNRRRELATDKLVYVTKISEEIVVVIANTSELNRRIELAPNRFAALFFSDLHETLILSSLTVDTHRRKSLSIAQKFGWRRLDIFIAFCSAIVFSTVLYAMPGYLPDSDANLLQAVINK